MKKQDISGNFYFYENGDFRQTLGSNGVRIEKNKNSQLETQPHYSDSRFKGGNAILVFGSDDGKDKDLWVNYDDRLMQWDYEKHNSAWEKAVSSGATKRSAKFYEKYLSEYHEQEMNLIWVKAGVSVSNGYPYVVFGYKPK